MATARGVGSGASRRMSAATSVPSTKRISMNSWPAVWASRRMRWRNVSSELNCCDISLSATVRSLTVS
jgi:hypothetical protein